MGGCIYYNMKYSLQQIEQLAAAVLFLIGAIFMLVDTFADQSWAFWTGLGFAVAATILYIFIIIENQKNIRKKLTDPSYSDNPDNKMEHENEKTKTAEAKPVTVEAKVTEPNKGKGKTPRRNKTPF